MFYDLENPIQFVKNIKSILKEDGILHIEVAYLPEIIKTFSYDTFCQEHYEYYSLTSLSYIFEKSNMRIINFGTNDINGEVFGLMSLTKYKTKDRRKKFYLS